MKKIISFLFTFFLVVGVYAQSAEVITSILETDEVTYGQVCYLSAVRLQLIKDKASYDDAVNILIQTGVIPEGVKSDEVINLQNVAYVFTKIWPEFRGGLMYRITQGAPRYAYKSLKDIGILNMKDDPFDKLSGFDVLNILSSCMMEFGSDEECMAMNID